MYPGGPGRSWLYVRVSGRAQANDGTSLDGQTEHGRLHFARLHAPPPEVCSEVESASDERIERRVVLHRLIRDAQPGDNIAVAALDRWSRDLVWGLKSIRALVDRGVGFFAIREQLDAATPAGRERLGLLLWVAESERGRIRERTVGRADELRRQGFWSLGTVPWGYRRGGRAERRHLQLEPDPLEAPLVVELHERLADGTSLRDAGDWLLAHPRAPHHAAALCRIVRGRIYLGEMRVGAKARKGGEWIKGQHPPLVTPELWTRVQAALDGRRGAPDASRYGDAHPDLLLAGLLVCGLCGRAVAVTRITHRPAIRYYVCALRRRPRDGKGTCAGPFARVEPVEEAVEEAVLARLADLRELLGSRAAPAPGAPRAPEDFDKARARIETRLARAVSSHVDGVLSAVDLAAQRVRLDGELVALRAREDAAAREVRAADPVARGDLRRALADVRRTWRKSTPGERREHLHLLASRVELLADKTLRWTWRTVEDLLTE